MTIERRKVLAGLAGTAAAAATPAWAQFGGAIQPQNDPWAQVDPYADSRNGALPFGDALPARKAPDFLGDQGAGSGPSRQDDVREGLFQALNGDEQNEVEIATFAMRYLLHEQLEMGGLHPNARAQAALRAFCRPFFEAADRRNLPWEVFLTQDTVPNGFTVGGGKVAICAGTVIYADHPGELASIVAHEIGHVDHRHITKKQEVRALMALDKAAGAFSRQGGMMSELGPMFEAVALMGFVREDEYEADQHILNVFERVGMDPARRVVLWKKMMKIFDTEKEYKSCLFDTHPTTNERMERFLADLGRAYRLRREFTPPGWEDLKRIFPTPSEYRWG